MTFAATITPQRLEAGPFPIYRRLRHEAPVVHVPGLHDQWLVTRFPDVRRALRDAADFTTRHSIAPVFFTTGEECVNDCEPATHQRHRGGLAETLSPRAVDAHARPYVQDLVDDALDDLGADDHADLFAQYFERISVNALTRLLGVPGLTTETITTWFHALSAGIENESVGDPEIRDWTDRVSREIDARLRPYIESVAQNPDGGALSSLFAHAQGETFEQRFTDIMPTAKVLIGAGQQEPGHGAANVAAGILSDEHTRATFAAAPAQLAAAAVEEGVRWIAPIQLVPRRTTRDVELGGVTIPEGSLVSVCVGSANRDQEVFGADADAFRLGRPRCAHLAFSFGDHFCAGNYFGRAVMSLSLQGLWERYPEVRLDGPVPFKGVAFRSPARLPVTLGRRAS
jgi:cytochrome P450